MTKPSEKALRKRVLVLGSSASLARETRRISRMTGVGLARAGFDLVTGYETGVDTWVAESFCTEAARLGRNVGDCYEQIRLPWWKNPGGRWCGRTLDLHAGKVANVDTRTEWRNRTFTCADAAVLIGGRRGSLQVAQRYIDRGKPVFPLPIVPGASGFVFREILKTWHRSPVPGLSDRQFLRLGLPWISGAKTLVDLLKGCLAERPEIFISYRRDDSETAVGRLYENLAEHFGYARVFQDRPDIRAGRSWQAQINEALAGCKVGIVVIGRDWSRSFKAERKKDVLFGEIRKLVKSRKAIIPLLLDGAELPDFPATGAAKTFREVFEHQGRSIDNANWTSVRAALIKDLERLLETKPGGEVEEPERKPRPNAFGKREAKPRTGSEGNRKASPNLAAVSPLPREGSP